MAVAAHVVKQAARWAAAEDPGQDPPGVKSVSWAHPNNRSPSQHEAAELLQQLTHAGALIEDLLDNRLFLGDILDSLFLIPQLLFILWLKVLVSK